MAQESDTEQVLHRLFEQVSDHIETRWTYFSIKATEKFSSIASNLVGAFTIFVFAVLVLFFFSMGFAWWLGDFIDNRAGGFALAGLIFVPIAFFVYRWIRPFVRDKIIESMLHDDLTENPNKNG
ncbi:MAG: phage holin family protein [Saprospiraceae bacterium]|nr:phage holin family protein [Saprospiraceae bacterium]